MSFPVALLLSWGLSLAFGARWAGWSSRPVLPKHPSAKISRLLAGQDRSLVAIISLLIGLALILASLWIGGPLGLGLGIAALLWVGPLPFFMIQDSRIDQRLRSRQIVVYNTMAPIGTSYERHLEEGRTRDVAAPIVLYIDEEDWRSLPHVGVSERNFLEGNYRTAPCLYFASGDNTFLQMFDSLKLWPFLVHPGNEKAMNAFRDALEARSAQARSQNAQQTAQKPAQGQPKPSAPAPSPSKPASAAPQVPPKTTSAPAPGPVVPAPEKAAPPSPAPQAAAPPPAAPEAPPDFEDPELESPGEPPSSAQPIPQNPPLQNPPSEPEAAAPTDPDAPPASEQDELGVPPPQVSPRRIRGTRRHMAKKGPPSDSAPNVPPLDDDSNG